MNFQIKVFRNCIKIENYNFALISIHFDALFYSLDTHFFFPDFVTVVTMYWTRAIQLFLGACCFLE